MQYVIIADHPPDLCPMGNGKTRLLLRETARSLPRLAEGLGVTILAWRLLSTEHTTVGIVEAASIEVVSELIIQSRLIQWNSVHIHPTLSTDEVLAKADRLTTLF